GCGLEGTPVLATSGGRRRRPWGRRCRLRWFRSAGLRTGVLLALGFLALPLHGRLLVVLAPASLGEDAALLDLLVEAAQGALERLVLPYSDFSQSVFTSSDQDLEALLRRGRPTGWGDSTDCGRSGARPTGWGVSTDGCRRAAGV